MLKQFMNSKKESKNTLPQQDDLTRKSQRPVYYEVFKEHWKQVLTIFNKSLINDDDIQVVKSNLNQMINLLLDELNNVNSYLSLKPVSDELENSNGNINGFVVDKEPISYGPIWNFVLKSNIFENIFLWSLSYPEYLFDLKYEQLRYYESLIYQMQANEHTSLLLHTQLNKPLFSLLNHCSTHNSEQIEKIMISILNQLCVCICKNSNLLEIFFQQAKLASSQPHQQPLHIQNMQKSISTNLLNLSKSAPLVYSSSSKFFIFSLLIPYIHKEGCLGLKVGSLTYGQQARDALLMIMQLSARNSNLAKYIVENTDFCPILATGLSGLYSELPQKLTTTESFDEIRYLGRDDIINTPTLNKFINSLEFCNNVIQVSHTLIANQLLQYVYYGFLVPVIAPALTQNCVDEIIASTAYLDLFLRTINEPNLLKIFLKFILHAKFDEKCTLLDTLISRINSNTRLSLVTLMLFSTMIDFNSEDVMYKLIFIYLLPCKHLMKSQISTLKQTSYEINGLNAQTFLSLATNFDNIDTKSTGKLGNTSYASILLCSNFNETTPLSKWFQSLFDANEISEIIGHLEGLRFNFVDYLKDAKLGIVKTANQTIKWSFNYDISAYSSDIHFKNIRHQTLKHPSAELDYDAEEYLLNLNIFSSSLVDPMSLNTKSSRSTMNLFSNHKDDYADFDSQSLLDQNRPKESDLKKSHQDTSSHKVKRKLKKSTKSSNRNTNTIASSSSKNMFDDHVLEELIDKVSKLKKRQRVKRCEKASDFYFLTFDNELSDSDASSTESSSAEETNEKKTSKIEFENEEEEEEDDEEEDDDEDLTNTSVSSSTTLNNNDLTVPEVASKQISDYRIKLIDYLFSNEEKSKHFLNGNLNNFLFALDDFFTANSLCQNKFPNTDETKTDDLNLLCDQILNIYNEFFRIQPKNAKNSEQTVITPRNESPSQDSAVATSTLNLTTFPAYASNRTSSHHSSSQSLIENLATDSGIIELTNSMTSSSSTATSNENDIGPFLFALFNRLDHMLSNSLQINFLLTGLFAKLAYYSQLLLRSFLLNHNLVVQSNIKTLIQVLGNVKFKIESCSKTYNNFSLLYFKAKLFLIKRIIDSKSNKNTIRTNLKFHDKPKFDQPENQQTLKEKKRFTMDRFLNFFLKPSTDLENKFSNDDAKPSINNSILGSETLSPQAEVDLNDISLKFSKFNKKPETNSFKQLDNGLDDFYLIENEWEDLKTRNIALSAVIYDEFIKELAAICEEHSVLTSE